MAGPPLTIAEWTYQGCDRTFIREVGPWLASKQNKGAGSMCSHTFVHRDPSAMTLQNPIGSNPPCEQVAMPYNKATQPRWRNTADFLDR